MARRPPGAATLPFLPPPPSPSSEATSSSTASPSPPDPAAALHSIFYYAIVGLLDGLVNEWLLRALVLLSFTMHLVLVVLGGIRRHRASGGWRFTLWLAYQLTSWSAPTAIGKLSLCSPSREQQLVAFWTPFLLMHLARPDNISAYSFEDNVLAGRQLPSVLFQVIGTSYVLYKHIIIVSDAGTLLPASYIMFSLGIAKYLESGLALWRGNLGNIRSSIKTMKKKGTGFKDDSGSWKDLDNKEALLVAHRVFYISKGAFADYSFRKDDSTSSKEVFARGWRDTCKVVEMELSLVYDIMYTKAAMVHTWCGYLIRLVSPFGTAAALSLFVFYSTDGLKRADVAITYILLIGTFLLDVGWLLRALGSTWAYAFFRDNCCLRSALILRRWHGLRHLVVSLGLPEDPSSYRMWSGIVGQYDILQKTTRHTINPCSSILKWIGMEESGMEYRYSKGHEIPRKVRDLLFGQIWKMLEPAYRKKGAGRKLPEETIHVILESAEPEMGMYIPDHEHAFDMRRKLDKALKFGPEFQEIVLTWHIATNIFLLCRLEKENMYTLDNVKAIEVLSNYMMFLVVVRPNMLPGLKLSSLYDATREALDEICKMLSNTESTARKRELASRLRDKCYKTVLLLDGTLYAELMLARLSWTNWNKLLLDLSVGDKSKEFFLNVLQLPSDSYSDIRIKDYELSMKKMLELILDSWVRLLIYASIRCSRDSHAKQLSCGGELTTIVWILAEHAGI